jgi:serine/threonine protein kinase
MNGDARRTEADAKPPAARYRSGDEPIPGYRLIEPLGKGGFGEVWKCQAPGGFLKAIKFVQGADADGDASQRWLAEQELRSLDLIKNIRHPFILTVERAELQQGTLMIVMELAERSLADLLNECTGKGERGVARAEVLRYMQEAAEALDLMNFEHGLQHLDVKPQNLFLVGGHVKVADFGLVNRLPAKQPAEPDADQSDRGVRGITPRYVAPEILQHHISRRSDQYSLAIVYQEMLTGDVPFKGRTGWQLFLQHQQAQPDLSPLPVSDRDAVARALAKDPDERFASCRDFARALSRAITGGSAVMPVGARSSEPRTDPSLNLKGKASLEGLEYGKSLTPTPLGEIWQVQAASGETRWAYHLQGFAVEEPAKQDEVLTYLQKFRHSALLRFKIAELAAHRIVLLYDPWGPSLTERCRMGKLTEQEMFRGLAEIAHAIDQLTALTNLEYLGLSPDTILQGLDGSQLRDFGLISLLWKKGNVALETLNPRHGAPELAQGRYSPASDVYSLAATYADVRTMLLTGRMWPAPRAHSRSRPSVIDLDSIPTAERRILRKALDPDPAQRFGTCVALIEALAQVLGGMASQTTTAVHSALAATQGSFLTTLAEWVSRQEAEIPPEQPAAPTGTGGLQAIRTIDIVPGTAKLRLDVFEQEWQAQRTLSRDPEFRFFAALERTLWQRLCGQQVGVDIHILLQPIDPQNPKRCRATLTVRPLNCGAVLAKQVTEKVAPAMMESLLRCLNAVGERRRNRRLPCRTNITIRHRPTGGRPTELHGEVLNISRHDIGVLISAPVALGSEIRLLLALPQPGEPLAVLLKAVVRRCDATAGGRFELGAQFVPDKGKEDDSVP